MNTPNNIFNFGSFISESNTMKNLPCDMLVPRHNHRFKLYEGERLQDMIHSIKENGVLTPIIVLHITEELIKNYESEMESADKEKRERLRTAIEFYREHISKYEILAGHNRKNVVEITGGTSIIGVIKENLTYDEAEMYVAETNLMQRGFDDLSITERAGVLAARHNAMFSEDKRKAIERELRSLNGETVVDEVEDDGTKKKSKLAATGEGYNMGKDNVARYIRIHKMLVDEIKPYVDNGKIPFRSAYVLTHIPPAVQRNIVELLEALGVGISMKKAELLREALGNNELDDAVLREILVTGNYKKKTEKTRRRAYEVKINPTISEKYFSPDWDMAQIQDIVNLALEQYFSGKH